MRIALLVSGLLRREEEGYKHIEKMILEPNYLHQIDIYLDIWINKISRSENTDEPKNSWRANRRSSLSFKDQHDVQKIFNLYKPFAMNIEDDSDCLLFKELAEKIKNPRTDRTYPYGAFYSQFFKIYSANRMRVAREKVLGIKYDACIRMRDDIILPKKINIENFELDDKKLYVENEGYPLNFKKYGWMSDKFVIASPKAYNEYASFVLGIKRMNDFLHDKTDTTPEIYMKNWVDFRKLQVIKDDRIGKIKFYI
jgi:hypothetical protein